MSRKEGNASIVHSVALGVVIVHTNSLTLLRSEHDKRYLPRCETVERWRNGAPCTRYR